MIAFDQGGKRFMLRAAAIIIHHDRVLLQQGKSKGAWVLPGGKVEMLERSSDTLQRELKEELGVDAHVGGLTAVIEHFDAYGTQGLHELGLYYIAQIRLDSPILNNEGVFAGSDVHTRLLFKWYRLDELHRLKLQPGLLQEFLPATPAGICHFVSQANNCL
jgi:8-oxo-dGTP pyrophosphatase MutT (NUDIX family)